MENKKDGKIVYKDGRTEVLEYGMTEIKDRKIGNSDVVSVVLPSSVSTINLSAFLFCRNLKSVEIPYGVKHIEARAFSGCHNLTSIEIPNSVTTIDENAFLCCTSLTSLEIPESVEKIGAGVFGLCTNLKIRVSPKSKHFKVVEDNLYTYDGKTLVGYLQNNGNDSFSVPDGVMTIDKGAFAGCYSIKSLEISSGVTTISDGAFYGCRNLTSIKIPASVTDIGVGAFFGCGGLADVYYTGTQEQWQKINIYSDNEKIIVNNNRFKNANIHYNCK